MNGVINAAGLATVMLKEGLACIDPRFQGMHRKLIAPRPGRRSMRAT